MQPNYRRCTSCRQAGPKSMFWRIVRVHPARTVQLDWGMGRSAYLCPSASCLKAAKQKNRLSRSLRAPVSEEIYQALEARLAAGDCSDNRQDRVKEIKIVD
ncbi:MAG: YlxR family protein [Cyanobacteria bacterium J06641_5]